MKEKSKKRYECEYCGEIWGVDAETEMSNIVCSCGQSGWRFISQEFSDEEWKKLKEDIKDTYLDVVDFIMYWMDMPEKYAKIVSLWILGTYMHDSFNTYPFLFLNAMRGSGKTRLLRIISHLSKGSEGDVQTGLTESVLFRSPKGETLVLDEFENASSKEKANLRTYLNACYKKGGTVKRVKKVNRKDGDNYEIDRFEPYKPIAMANISGMEDVLGDRCLTLIIDKSQDKSKTKLVEDFSDNSNLHQIKVRLIRFSVGLCSVVSPQETIKGWNNYIKNQFKTTPPTTTLQYTNIHYKLYKKIDKAGVDGRNFELLIPIFLIADYLGEDILDEILDIGKEIASMKKEDEFIESQDIQFIDFISKQDSMGRWVGVKELTHSFRGFIDASAEDEWANQIWVGRALKRLNLIHKKRRVSKGMEIMLDVNHAIEKMKMFGK